MSESFYLRRLILLNVLLFSAFSDIFRSKISNRIILFGFVISTITGICYPPEIESCTLTIMILFMAMLLIFWTKGKIGAGDIKLIALITYILPNAESFEIVKYSFIAAGIWGIIIMFSEKKTKPEKKLPLAACTFIGAVAESLIFRA